MKPIALALIAAAVLGTAFFMYTGIGTMDEPVDAGMSAAEPASTNAQESLPGPNDLERAPEVEALTPDPPAERRGVAAVAFELNVLNIMGKRVPDVTVKALRDGESRVLGKTNNRGRFDVELDDKTDVRILAEHPEYQSASFELLGVVPDEIEILLPPGASVVGKVSLVDGRPIPEGTRALVWDTRDPMPRRAWKRAFGAGDPRVHTVVVGSDGMFEVPGLDPDIFYQVRAGAPGYAMIEESPIAQASGSMEKLTLAPLYGMLVSIRTTGGAALETSAGFFSQAGAFWSAGDTDARPMRDRYRRVDLLLAGVDPALLEPENPQDVFVALLSAHHKPDLAQVRFNYRNPGYQPLSEELTLPPLQSEPARKVVEMRPMAKAWGDLVVRFEGVPSGLPALTTGGFGQPTLVLTDSEGNHNAITFTTFEERTLRVPEGPYQGRFTALNGMFKYPGDREPLRVDVGPRPRAVTIDLSTTGAFVFEVEDAHGIPFEGTAMMRVISKKPPSMRIVEVSGPPFVLVGLTPGPYTIEAILGLDFPKPGESPYKIEAEVEVGEIRFARMVGAALGKPKE
ncbi:MAG: carboxypeptidase regulatory-like domain-containing protein [bacterium]|nr:carboxypeptidase regulatory-like domain-containing protein [bacterium]